MFATEWLFCCTEKAFLEQRRHEFDVFVCIKHRQRGAEAQQQWNRLSEKAYQAVAADARCTDDQGSDKGTSGGSMNAFRKELNCLGG